MKNILVLTALFLIISLSSCSKNNPVTPTIISQPTSGGLSIAFEKVSIPASVAIVIATLNRDQYVPLQQTLNVLTDSSAEVTFAKIAVGTWKLDVKAYGADSSLKYQGSTNVTVLDGQTTIVYLTMDPVTSGVGSVKVVVTWSPGQKNVWIDNPLNPILTRQNTIYDGRGVGYPIIFKDVDGYKMYYTNTGSVPDSLGRICTIGLATSTDGNNWKHYSKEPILLSTPNSWDAYIVSAGSIIKEGGSYKMYFTGMGTGENSRYAIGLATSNDGIHWEKRSQPVFQGNNSWENNNAGTVAVLKVNNMYWMYYTGYPISYVGLATSVDGITWTRNPTNPVLMPTQSWEITGVGYATVLYENSSFKMAYSNNGYIPKFGYATSSDGKNWTKSSANPIFTSNDSKNNWAPYGIGYPCLTKIENQYRIYYSGAISSSYGWTIGYATLLQ